MDVESPTPYPNGEDKRKVTFKAICNIHNLQLPAHSGHAYQIAYDDGGLSELDEDGDGPDLFGPSADELSIGDDDAVNVEEDL